MIRFANDSDLEFIYNLICDMENTQLDYQKFEQIFKNELLDENFFCFVFEKENEVIGCLNLRLEYQLHHVDRIAEIMELAVKDDYRSCGIGRQLFSRACEIAQEQQCLQIEVCCNQLRTQAHHFYERKGMKKFHYKFTMNLYGESVYENRFGL